MCTGLGVRCERSSASVRPIFKAGTVLYRQTNQKKSVLQPGTGYVYACYPHPCIAALCSDASQATECFGARKPGHAPGKFV